MPRPTRLDPAAPVASLLTAAGHVHPDGTVHQVNAARALCMAQSSVAEALGRGPAVQLATLARYAAALGITLEIRAEKKSTDP